MKESYNNKVLKINSGDNVFVALEDLKAGTEIIYESHRVRLIEDIPAKHKFPVADLNVGDEIIMYGVLVGIADINLMAGALLTENNIHHASNENYKRNIDEVYWEKPSGIEEFKSLTFDGYQRNDGSVGTRNYWLFFPMVFCENRNLEVIKEALLTELGYKKENKYRALVRSLISGESSNGQLIENDQSPFFENVDGIKFLLHQGGCGGTHDDVVVLAKLLAGYADHPNVAGVTVLSLGCQHLQVQLFKEVLEERNPSFDKPLLIFEQQKYQGLDRMLYDVIEQTMDGLRQANKIKRKASSLSHLCLGMECGGSDGFSGISANPVVGRVADYLSGLDGKVMLSEFPELFGAEQDLVNRMVNDRLAEKFTFLMKSYNASANEVGSGFDMNPSPGNIRDGLITDAIKSLGAAQKGGRSPVNDVLDYTEKVKENGLSLLCTPGNDVESTTGLAGSGANMILFTTGLGTPTGNPISPTMKISSNTQLAEKMPDIIDFDTGGIIRGEESLDEVAERLFTKIIEVASGREKTKAELLGQDDFIPWRRGVSL